MDWIAFGYPIGMVCYHELLPICSITAFQVRRHGVNANMCRKCFMARFIFSVPTTIHQHQISNANSENTNSTENSPRERFIFDKYCEQRTATNAIFQEQ